VTKRRDNSGMTSAQDGDQSSPRHAAPEPDESTVDTSSPTPEPIKRTRISGTWIAVVVALIVGVFLLVFILQNLDTATVHFLGMAGSLPLAVAMLFSAVAGALLVALIGAARILQLRKETRKARKAVR
jgi:uncharacterized integral membrane protein